eukprot:650196-Hanusia_phi.AAC.1
MSTAGERPLNHSGHAPDMRTRSWVARAQSLLMEDRKLANIAPTTAADAKASPSNPLLHRNCHTE